MRLKPTLAVLFLQIGLVVLGLKSPLSVVTLSLLSSGLFLASQNDFESMAKHLVEAGVEAKSPALIMGRSGVRHEFAFAVVQDSRAPKVVVDTTLSVNEVDEMKVLAFYVKVFDVSPEKAVLAVSPKLNEKARALAREYRLIVVENEAPRKLVPMVAEAVEKILNEPWRL